MFNLTRTRAYQAILSEPLFKMNKAVKGISFAIFSVSLATYIFYAFAKESGSWILPIISLFFSIMIISITIDSFYDSFVRKGRDKKRLEEVLDDPSKDRNLADYIDLETAKIFFNSLTSYRESSVSSSSLLFNLINSKDRRMLHILSRLMLSRDYIKDRISASKSENVIPCDEIVMEAIKTSVKRGGDRVSEGDLFCALSFLEPNMKKLLVELSIKREDIENVNWWGESIMRRIEFFNKFWEYDNLIRTGSVGGDWAAGWTPTLDRYSVQWTSIVGGRGYEEIVGYKEEVEMLEDALAKKGSKNALIVGEIGSGRKNIVHSVIKKSFSQQSFPEINNKKFIEIDLISLTSSLDSVEKAESAITACFNEAIRAGNIILIINNLQEFIDVQKAGVIDISGILLPYLNNSRLQLICITTYGGLHQKLEGKPGILQAFTKIEIKGMTEQDTLLLLESKSMQMESEYKKFISYQALKEIIIMTGRYISTPLPEKATSLLEDVFSFYSNKEDYVIDAKVVDDVLTKKIEIPVGALDVKEKNLLLEMENELHTRVVGQHDAIKDISAALRRARSGVQTRKGPMGSFLFLGPTGVGKTETAKALADIYFGSEEKLIRLDMSEFQRVEDIPRLMGSETQEGILTTKVRETPFSLVLLDEIEKAYPDILNLFLQVLDEGYLNDNYGQKVSFLNTIVIATSNAGYQIILESVKNGKGGEEIKEELLNNIFEKGLFRPEFINRFDSTVVFRSLTEEELLQIAGLQLEKLKKRLAEKEIKFIVSDELKRRIVELSYNPSFGAREMKRVIQDKVEDSLAQAFLADKIQNGATIEIDPEQFYVLIQNPE
ncbi:MAG: AAA family ATPase [Candidatus Pacebacteria bacterium]|nr:AAA family ATPase [Candidatus Paceibacterota bacterium]